MTRLPRKALNLSASFCIAASKLPGRFTGAATLILTVLFADTYVQLPDTCPSMTTAGRKIPLLA
jgi:hypothetical protein